MNVETRYASFEGASIAYQTIGQGETDFVVVPCWLSHLDRMWREPHFIRFVERLSTFGRVILFDKRGTGLSDPVASSHKPALEDRVADLAAVLDAAGSKKAVLLGNGVGGRLSVLYSVIYPERVSGLILFGSAARGSWAPDYTMGKTPEELEQQFDQIYRLWGGPIWLERYAHSLTDDKEFSAWWAECLRSAGGPGAAVAGLRMAAESDIRGVLPSVTTPTLVLHRRGDRVVSFEQGQYLAERIPTARFVELQGDDHLPFVGDQEALFRQIGRFVRDDLRALLPKRSLATAVAVSFTGVREAAQRAGSEQWAKAQASLASAIRSAHRSYRGMTAMPQGDGFVTAIDGPSRAIRFANEITEEARRHGLRARVGLHTGTVEHSDKLVGGPAAELAERIAAVARGNEILVSGTVMGLVSGSGVRGVITDDRDQPGLPPGLRLFRLADEPTPATTRERIIIPAPKVRSYGELSPREREVAFSVARGLSNREVGAELAISVSTVERHVANILAKLGYRSRAQLTLWAAAQRSSHPHLGVPEAAMANYAAD